MFFKRVGVFLVVMGLVLGGAGSALAAKDSFLGTWNNLDANTGGLTKLVVTTDGTNYFVQGFGACTPTDCDWGTKDLTFMAYGVSDDNFEWAMAIWDFSYKYLYLILHIQGSQMVVDSFNVYTPEDGRTPYRSLYLMKKE